MQMFENYTLMLVILYDKNLFSSNTPAVYHIAAVQSTRFTCKVTLLHCKEFYPSFK